MKYSFIFVLAFLLVSSVAFADAFAPTLMKLSAAPELSYAYDGSDLDIGFDLSGYDGTVVLVVMTKDKGQEIGFVRNGNLGWHYVNKIDTTVYFSDPKQFGIGTGTIAWDGKDLDNNLVGEDTYQYYLWAYAHSTVMQPAAPLMPWGWLEKGHIYTLDEEGTPLTQPMICTKLSGGAEGVTEISTTSVSKWNLGDDPMDDTKIQSTLVEVYDNYTGGSLDPDDYSIYYQLNIRTETNTCFVNKKIWVPDDLAEQDMDWGEDEGSFTYSIFSPYGHMMGAVALPVGRILCCGEWNHWTDLSKASGMYRLDMDTGEQIDHLDLWDLFVREGVNDEGETTYNTDGPWHAIIQENSTKMLMNGSWGTSHYMVIDPWSEDAEPENILYWENSMGDGFMDKLTDESPSQMSYLRTMDANGFMSNGTYDLGNLSFDLNTPDGTGIGFFAFINETAASKPGPYYLDNDTAYDGMYRPCSTTAVEGEERPTGGWWYTGHDSIKGVIKPEGSGVEDASPAAFAVDQNSPNPCNPTTTIGFAIAEAGNVTIDVYNVAGQKVDTIVNNYMDAGKHSVVWDGSDFSAGVYFYTVKSGDFSKTMKMTLLK